MEVSESKQRVLVWVLEYALAQGWRPISKILQSSDKLLFKKGDEATYHRMRLELIREIAEDKAQHDQLPRAIQILKETVPDNEKNEVYHAILIRMKAQACVHNLRKKPFNIQGFLDVMNIIFEENPMEREFQEDMKELEKAIQTWNAENQVATETITALLDKYDWERSFPEFSEYIDYLLSLLPAPFLEMVETDIRRGRYYPSDDDNTISLTGIELRKAFEGSESQWQSIFNQTHPQIRSFLQRKREKEAQLRGDVLPTENEPKLEETEEKTEKKKRGRGRKKEEGNGGGGSATPGSSKRGRKSNPPPPPPSIVPLDLSSQSLVTESTVLVSGGAVWDEETLAASQELLRTPGNNVEEVKERLQESIKKKKEKPKYRRRWTEEEVILLYRGVAKFGTGNWSKIRDYFGIQRRSVDLKDKWRNEEKRPEICHQKLQEELDRGTGKRDSLLDDKNLQLQEEEERTPKRHKLDPTVVTDLPISDEAVSVVVDSHRVELMPPQ